MKSKSADKIKMPSIDELLGVSGEESATDIEISRIHSFANHPFKVLDDDKMDDLVESIKQNGVLTPVLVRPDKNNSYEMISSDSNSSGRWCYGSTYGRRVCGEIIIRI